MTDLGCRYYVGITSVLRRCAILTVILAVPAQATPFGALWSEFERRCLIPFEGFQPAQVADLPPVAGRDGAYQLPKGAILVLSGEGDDGSRSCTVEGAGLQKGYRTWVAKSLQSGDYRETDTPGLWLSHEWIEPRIQVEKTPGAIRVLETFLEA